MKTLIRAKEAEWTPEIRELWDKLVVPYLKEGEKIVQSNYFTPRPYRNEYDRGSKQYGFCYVITSNDNPDYRVFMTTWEGEIDEE